MMPTSMTPSWTEVSMTFRTVLIELDGDLRIVLLEFAKKLCKDMRIGDRRQPDLDGILLQVEFIFKIRLQVFKNKKTPLRIVQENGPAL